MDPLGHHLVVEEAPSSHGVQHHGWHAREGAKDGFQVPFSPFGPSTPNRSGSNQTTPPLTTFLRGLPWMWQWTWAISSRPWSRCFGFRRGPSRGWACGQGMAPRHSSPAPWPTLPRCIPATCHLHVALRPPRGSFSFWRPLSMPSSSLWGASAGWSLCKDGWTHTHTPPSKSPSVWWRHQQGPMRSST